MAEYTLFAAPGYCARVSAICLEETGVAFDVKFLQFGKGEQKSPAYKRINPKGKVPTLLVDGSALTENVAIILYLNRLFPQARLLPSVGSKLEEARQVADLCFCSATLHPLISRIRLPERFASPDASRSVWVKACEALQGNFQIVEDRLEDGPWWYGADWSAMDAYLYWIFWRANGADFGATPYPRFCAHARKMEQRPAVQRSLARFENPTG